MGRQLKIVKSQLTEVSFDRLGAFRLRVDVSDPEGTGTDPNVFLYNLLPVNPYNQTRSADFMAVASPVDLEEYPVGQPDDRTAFPIFRLNCVELDFRSTEQAEETWSSIVAEIDTLIKTLNRMDVLVPVVELRLGDVLEIGSSESGSDSTSSSV